MVKKFLSVILVGALFFLVTGCTDSKKAEVKQSAGSEDLSGVVLRIGAASGKNGQSIINAAGLQNTPYKVEFHVMQGGNLVLEAMAANQIDLGTGSQIPPIFASQGTNAGNLKIFATKKATTLEQELVVLEKSGITSVAQLKGKKVAYVKATTAHYFLAKMLEQAGLKWSDIDAIALSTSNGLSALLSGEVDALASYGNSIKSAKGKGAVTLQSAANILSGDFYWYATPDSIKDSKKRAAIVDYLARFNAANEWARKNPDAWAKAYGPEINQAPDKYIKDFLEEEKQTETRIVPIDDATIASEQDIANVFTALGVLDKKIDVTSIFDRSLEKELSNLKKY